LGLTEAQEGRLEQQFLGRRGGLLRQHSSSRRREVRYPVGISSSVSRHDRRDSRS
jgi:hypothetical protein